MKRYWFEFEDGNVPSGIGIGCGVTAYDYADAINLISVRVFKGKTLPKIKRYVEDINVSSLDANHVLPNMSIPTLYGIWFPLGYN